MSSTKFDVLSLRDGRTIQGTCKANSFSFSTHESTRGFTKGSLKRIQFGVGLDSDTVEPRSGKPISGKLLSSDKKLFFEPEGQNVQTFWLDDITCLEFKEFKPEQPPAETEATGILPDEDEDNGPSCAICGCTEDRPCPGGCYWVDDGAMRDVCSNCVPPSRINRRKRSVIPVYGQKTQPSSLRNKGQGNEF